MEYVNSCCKCFDIFCSVSATLEFFYLLKIVFHLYSGLKDILFSSAISCLSIFFIFFTFCLVRAHTQWILGLTFGSVLREHSWKALGTSYGERDWSWVMCMQEKKVVLSCLLFYHTCTLSMSCYSIIPALSMT